MDKCREEFESWYKNFSGCDVINFDELGTPFVGEYKRANNWLQNTTLLYSWQAWKASRESMKAIKFPKELTPEYEGDFYKDKFEEAYCDGYNEALSLAEDAITLEGYKVE